MPILKVIPTPDNARIAPEDKLLYQYAFSSEFRESALGQLVHELIPICSIGGYITSVPFRHVILSASARCLGFEHELAYHLGVSLRMLPTTGLDILYEVDRLCRTVVIKAVRTLTPHVILQLPVRLSIYLTWIWDGTIDNSFVRTLVQGDIVLSTVAVAFSSAGFRTPINR